MLVSGKTTTYPNLCAKVTASFSVLSDTINTVNSSLLEKEVVLVDEENGTVEDLRKRRIETSKFIKELQKYECEKLNLTAALHLEQLRLRNLQLGGDQKDIEDDDDGTKKLLRTGIQTLEQKIAVVVESINEVLEELRCFIE